MKIITDNTRNRVIHSVADLCFVPTEVTVHEWNRGTRVEIQSHALLYDGEPRVATMLRHNNYGEPYIATKRLVKVVVEPHAQHPAALAIYHQLPRKRRLGSCGYMPFDALGLLVIAWGDHPVEMPAIPKRSPILWHDGDGLVSCWREAHQRFLQGAGDSIWLDTAESALRMFIAKHPERFQISPPLLPGVTL